ncbi:unnamed protein product [Ectocarpus sp. CCAP 1310/34]|nr:unnamed protein product [Ectocarpus sp. CCAP 1310/34]
MKNKSVEDRFPQMKSFHRRLRQLLQEPPVRRAAAGGAAENNCAAIVPVESPLHGRFSLNARFNVDQVGLAFVNGLDSTWDETGALRVQIGQPFPGLEKRQCTVNCFIGAGDKLMRTVVIFRGKGKVSAVEKAAYDPGVDVLFQENAWMDGPTCMAWAKNSFLRSIKGEEGVVPEEQSILFADNLHAQTTDEFKKFLHGECNTLLRLLPPKLTDELQPVDAGYGRLLKVEVAGARRILFTRFTARAVARMGARPGYRHRLFEKTGLTMTADGSLDDRITPEGVVGAYNFMDGGTSSEEEMPDRMMRSATTMGGRAAANQAATATQAQMMMLDSDDDVDSDDDIIAMELPVGFCIQESPPEKLDRALIKRCVFLIEPAGVCEGEQPRRQGSRARTPNVRNIDQPG